MIDYARPYDQNMCDYYLPQSPAPARLDDFQVFKKGSATCTYGNYYTTYDVLAEPEVDSATNVYHNLVNLRESYRQEDWRYKGVIDWSADDTFSWIFDCAVNEGYNGYDIPFYNLRIPGIEFKNFGRDDILHRMMHPSIDPIVSRRIADILYDKLQIRLSEEMLRHSTVLKYADPYQNQESVQTMLDLDSIDHNKNRLYASDYKPNDGSFMQPADSSDDAEDVFGSTETASPECAYGSDGSKSSDDEDKRKLFKRPPGRPKGSGRKVGKRPRSVSVPEFLRNLLFDEKYCPSIIKWEDYSQGKFRFVKPDEVAKLWGQMKQNDNMTFEKFSRAMRYHYRQSVLVSVPTARLVYQFGHKGPDFRTDNPNFVKVKSELDVHDMTFSNS
ncbi:ETS-related transcription factor Elf-3-like [Colias croceus]|uniref:ETS-related transcription factor Elf-3-like n=1 Tax=Colias crocea TaxID=72248 RepID=UPI001E27DAE4|nr:ETS-related transcription factor Elf-3-like [Colias croceus]